MENSEASSSETRKLRVRKSVTYNNEETPPKKQKLETDKKETLEELYKRLTTSKGKSTNLETIYESPKKRFMSTGKSKRTCAADFYQPTKIKLKTRKDKAKKLAKLSGVRIPSGNLFSVEDVATVLNRISDTSEDESPVKTVKLNQSVLKTPVFTATPKRDIVLQTPESSHFTCGNMIVVDDSYNEVKHNWKDVMGPDDLFNFSMSVLDDNITDDGEVPKPVQPIKRRERRSGGFREHFKSLLHVRKELCTEKNSPLSFKDKLESVAENNGCSTPNSISSDNAPIIFVEHCSAGDNDKLSSTKKITESNAKEIPETVTSTRLTRKTRHLTNQELSVPQITLNEQLTPSPATVCQTGKLKKRRISGVQKALYASFLSKSSSADENSDCSPNVTTPNLSLNDVDNTVTVSTSFTDEDGNMLSEDDLKKNSPEIVLKYKCIIDPNDSSPGISPLTDKMKSMKVQETDCTEKSSLTSLEEPSQNTNRKRVAMSKTIMPSTGRKRRSKKEILSKTSVAVVSNIAENNCKLHNLSEDNERNSPTLLMSQLSLQSDNSTTNCKKMRRRSVRLLGSSLPKPTEVDAVVDKNITEPHCSIQQKKDVSGFGSLWMDKTPPVTTIKKTRRRSALFRPGISIEPEMDVSVACNNNDATKNEDRSVNKRNMLTETQNVDEKKVAGRKKSNNSKAVVKVTVHEKKGVGTRSITPQENCTTAKTTVTALKPITMKKGYKKCNNFDDSVEKSKILNCNEQSSLPVPTQPEISMTDSATNIEFSTSKMNNELIVDQDIQECDGLNASIKKPIDVNLETPEVICKRYQNNCVDASVCEDSKEYSQSTCVPVLSAPNSPSPSSSLMPHPPTEAEIKKAFYLMNKYKPRSVPFFHPSQGLNLYEDGNSKKVKSASKKSGSHSPGSGACSPSQGSRSPVSGARSPKTANISSKSGIVIHPALLSCESTDILSTRRAFQLNSKLTDLINECPASSNDNTLNTIRTVSASPKKDNSASNSSTSSPKSNRGSPGSPKKNKIMLTSLSETEALFDMPSPTPERKDYFKLKNTTNDTPTHVLNLQM